MNIKALITALVLGSSSIASANTLTFSGSVNVSLGSSTARPVGYTRPVASSRPYSQVITNNAPVSRVPTRPLPQFVPYYNPQNTSISANKSVYRGTINSGTVSTRELPNHGYWIGAHRPAWFDLTEATRIDSGRQYFLLGAEKGQFRALMFQGMGSGQTHIGLISIHLIEADGSKRAQVVQVNRALDRSNPTITIDLDGNYRSIEKIIVMGSTDRGTAYKIMAM